MVRKETALDLLGVRARSFSALISFADDCIKEKVSVGVVDSITHPWRELCDSYLVQLNEKRVGKGWQKIGRLEFQHWGEIKAMWEPWSEFFLNSPLHLIVCGRAGAIWEFEKNEEGRKELVKAGTKMKVEGEFGFEPSLLIEMEREQVPDGQGGFKLIHIATVLGDRFGVLDGKTETNPTFEFFQPHIAMLRAGAHAPVDVSTKTRTGADVEGGDWEKERRQRTILCEEIQGAIVSKYPGQTNEEKRTKGDLLFEIFGTRSWTKVENMQSSMLRDGLQRLNVKLGINLQGELSIDETDDGDLGPQKPQEPAGVVATPPATQTPASAPADTTASPLVTEIRNLITSKGGLTEIGLVQLLMNIGSTTPGMETLEAIAKTKPSLLEVVAKNWDTYVQAAKEWR
jgi:hypothetical protein